MSRLSAMGADLKRIYFVNGCTVNDNKRREFNPAEDMPKLCESAKKIGNIKLIIVDPVVSVISGDSHKNSEVRRDLQPLVDLGNKLKAAILGITHFTKGGVGQ